MIQITKSIAIDESELQEDFMRSSGAGGQNVQKDPNAGERSF
jgi:ribosome-associated protein